MTKKYPTHGKQSLNRPTKKLSCLLDTHKILRKFKRSIKEKKIKSSKEKKRALILDRSPSIFSYTNRLTRHKPAFNGSSRCGRK